MFFFPRFFFPFDSFHWLKSLTQSKPRTIQSLRQFYLDPQRVALTNRFFLQYDFYARLRKSAEIGVNALLATLENAPVHVEKKTPSMLYLCKEVTRGSTLPCYENVLLDINETAKLREIFPMIDKDISYLEKDDNSDFIKQICPIAISRKKAVCVQILKKLKFIDSNKNSLEKSQYYYDIEIKFGKCKKYANECTKMLPGVLRLSKNEYRLMKDHILSYHKNDFNTM